MISRQRKIDTPRISWPDKLAYALVPCLCNILSIAIISFYPISEQAHAQIQREIRRL